MEHSVHCTTHAFIQTIASLPAAQIKKKLRAHHTQSHLTCSHTVVDESDAEDDKDKDNDTGDDNHQSLEMTKANLDNNKDFNPGDLIGKVLAFVNQVHAPPQARAYFVKHCTEEGVKPLQLLKWVCTRWAPLFDPLNHLLEVKAVSAIVIFLYVILLTLL